MRIVETDNYGGDYPDEKFVNLPTMNIDSANYIAEAINDMLAGDRYWKVVEDDYELIPGFEP